MVSMICVHGRGNEEIYCKLQKQKNSGVTNMSFYVTKYRNTLSADTLETLVRGAS